MNFIKIGLFVGWVLLQAGCSVIESGNDSGRTSVIDSGGKYPYTFMFYNVENLFHPSDDPIPGDDDFTAEGVRHWSYNRYNRKVSTICKVILAAGDWEPPLLIGLCEVENERVLKDLIYHPLLREYDYHYLHRNSNDRRGIDVALLFRHDQISCLSHDFISNCLPGGRNKTREILHGTFLLEADTIDIFINHWTSKYGGAFETEKIRVYQAQLLSGAVDSILMKRDCSRIIISGDFNDNSDSRSIGLLTQGGTLSEIFPSTQHGSYKFQGKWDLIDHLFIAGNWSQQECRSAIFSVPFLLETDLKYTGVKPFRTYAGFKYNGGISDHLPVLLHFNLEELAGQ